MDQGNVAQGLNSGRVISPGAFQDYDENLNPIYYDDNADTDHNNDLNYPVQPSSSQGKSVSKENVSLSIVQNDLKKRNYKL